MSNAETLGSGILDELRAKQRATWASGDYARIGVTLQIVGESLCETIDLRPVSRVLDVAAGNGNATLAAARRFCDVTAVDYVPALLEAAKARTEAEGQEVKFIEGIAELLPFENDSFDAVLSTFGVMFAADHKRAAGEMLRVCRPGGTIGLANWTPQGFIGQMFKVVSNHVPAPPGAVSPLRWGTMEGLREYFPGGEAVISVRRQTYVFRYRSVAHFVDVFRDWYGPVLKAFESLPAERRTTFKRELSELLASWNRSGDETLVVPAEYLEVQVTKL